MILSHFLVYTVVLLIYFGLWNFNQDNHLVQALNKHPILMTVCKYIPAFMFMQAVGYGAAIQNYLTGLVQ